LLLSKCKDYEEETESVFVVLSFWSKHDYSGISARRLQETLEVRRQNAEISRGEDARDPCLSTAHLLDDLPMAKVMTMTAPRTTIAPGRSNSFGTP